MMVHSTNNRINSSLISDVGGILTDAASLADSALGAIERADRARFEVSSLLDGAHRSRLGQFMTPAPVAEFMAGMFAALPSAIRLLDAGAGMGALTAAFVREACSRTTKPVSIDVTAFELEPMFLPTLRKVLSGCAAECQEAGVSFRSRVIQEDYIEAATAPLLSQEVTQQRYDCAILNPPYAKVRADSAKRAALQTLGIETSNLYSAFVAVAVDQLKQGGQLVAITPRSFCNGPYFKPFRVWLLARAGLTRAHVYESRKDAFRDDAVLQENIIFHLVKGIAQPQEVTISASDGPSGEVIREHLAPFSAVVVPGDPHHFIHLVPSEADILLAERVRALPSSLAELGIQVSTGRVVDFRSRGFLRALPDSGTAPLIYPCHFQDGVVKWPQPECRKPNALALNTETETLMVPMGAYVLTKRFTSKEERRRLVAAVLLPEALECESASIGFENHVNYFHCEGRGIDALLAKGLSLFLNTTAVDQYFRQFSGHTQVNATDLRSLRFPTLEQLICMGRAFQKTKPQHQIDQLMEECLWS
jgi:adenine-specific DNA-methyltransferase